MQTQHIAQTSGHGDAEKPDTLPQQFTYYTFTLNIGRICRRCSYSFYKLREEIFGNNPGVSKGKRSRELQASNNFQFKSFRDRIKEVDIRRSAFYHVETSEDKLSEQGGTFFYSALKTWSVLNLTNEYAEYQRKFQDSNTLTLLIFNKDAIMTHLLSCLRETSDAAVQPLLELVVAVAKDLRKEFYNYFSSVFDVLASFLRSASADRVELTLICLAHLFKALRGILRNHFTNTFELLSPLLNESNSVVHAVNFATECLGYLARDLNEKRTLIDMLLKFQMQSDGRSSVCGHVLFEILNGVQNQFHTTAKQTLQQYFDILQQLNQEDGDHLQEILTQTITDIVDYIHPGDIIIFWEAVQNTIEHCIDLLCIQQTEVPSSKTDAKLITYLTRILQLAGIALEYNDGKLLGNSAPVAVSQLIRLLTFVPSSSEEFSETIVNHIIILLRSKNIHLSHLEASRLARNMMMLNQRSLYERNIPYEQPWEDLSSDMGNSKDADDTSKTILVKVMPCLIKKQNIDYNNVRFQLLNMLRSCTGFCRSQGDRIVDSFFSFLSTTNIENDGNEDTTTSIIETKRHKRGPDRQQILLCYLNICSELDKEMIEEKVDKLYAVFEKFISSRNEELQQAALNELWHFTGHAPGIGKELDFYDNITHLQPHQHGKALKRFANQLQYVMPTGRQSAGQLLKDLFQRLPKD
ncbi:hypothetical protein AND_004484 [Anopheles darlingi]|uniref:Uncharacterized protein n=1 Tax=Anopheles darlingi TaxID=43151 RepID=W5JLK7_ANODA|nr:hypothetical protein AND_004484 [Anopheles darlingi]